MTESERHGRRRARKQKQNRAIEAMGVVGREEGDLRKIENDANTDEVLKDE